MNLPKIHRLLTFLILPVLVLIWFWARDPNGGAQLETQVQTLLGLFTAAIVTYLMRKALMPGDSKEAWERAMLGNLPAAIAWAAMAILTGILFLVISGRAVAGDTLPGNARHDLLILADEIDTRWADLSMPSVLAAQVEQESGWKPTATLHTTREDGAGYGQFTRAYRADGSIRFDALAEVARMDPSLRNWTWADRYNPRLQLRAVVVKNRGCYWHIRGLALDDYNALAMCDAAYNGGEGGLMAERRLCNQVAGCDPARWFGNVAKYSGKSRAKWKGYGQSAFEINRGHVINVMQRRRPKYAPWFGEQT